VTQLLVYVGGTLVLVVFGVMLTAQGPFISMKAGAAEWGIAAVVGLVLYAVIAYSVLQPRDSLSGNLAEATRTTPARPAGVMGDKPPAFDPATARNTQALGEAFLNVTQVTPERELTGVPGGVGLRNEMKRQPMGYLLPFEIVSVHLLVVLIGAAYLARAKRRRGGAS
jgi:NADH-quinone oxidoreductase subunit J